MDYVNPGVHCQVPGAATHLLEDVVNCENVPLRWRNPRPNVPQRSSLYPCFGFIIHGHHSFRCVLESYFLFVGALFSMEFQEIAAELSPLDDYGFPSKQTNRGSQ
jgi:hypothetical protein